jgi:hypothetical protein
MQVIAGSYLNRVLSNTICKSGEENKVVKTVEVKPWSNEDEST